MVETSKTAPDKAAVSKGGNRTAAIKAASQRLASRNADKPSVIPSRHITRNEAVARIQALIDAGH